MESSSRSLKRLINNNIKNKHKNPTHIPPPNDTEIIVGGRKKTRTSRKTRKTRKEKSENNEQIKKII